MYAQRRSDYSNRGQFQFRFKVVFNLVLLFFWAGGFWGVSIDGHPQAMVLLFRCSLSQGFKYASIGIALFYLFHLFHALQCITRGGVLHIQVSARNESHMGGDRGVK